MKRSLILNVVLFIILSSLLLISCEPGDQDCPDDDVKYLNMLSYKKELLPYYNHPYDTLYFINSKGDTQSLYGAGIETFYMETYENNPNPECANVKTVFKEESYRSEFNAAETLKVEHTISGGENLKLYFNGSAFRLHDIWIGRSSELSLYYDSLEINNHWFYKVTRHDGINKEDKIWLTTSDGVVQIYSKKDHQTWSLLK